VSTSSSQDPKPGDAIGLAAAGERLEAVLAGFNRLTPDELARIGLWRRDPGARAQLLATASAAARDAGRTELLADARRRARDMILRRYQQGAIHPTFLTLNWGISQGTTEDRVAIIDALQDAATAAVVADLVDPEVADALAADASEILRLAGGMAYEGSFDRAVAPAPPGYADHPIRRTAIAFVAIDVLLVGWLAIGLGGSSLEALVALLIGGAFALLIVRRSRQQRNEPALPDDA
jgi:hypothetical protein